MSVDKPKEKRGWKEFLKFLLLFIVILALLEGLCFLLIKGLFPNYENYPYNRIVSGSTLFYNTPGYNYGSSTIKNSPTEKDLCIDSNGFVCGHPLLMHKPKEVIRIFLIGGSALFGSGQSRPYDQLFAYPSGNYSWESSIAGCLQRKLDSLAPNKKFEVINAACSGFTTKQALALYIENICRYQPDYLIEMDGMNDLGNMISGREIDMNEIMFRNYFELATRNKNLLGLNMIKIVQLLQSRMLEKRTEKVSQSLIASKLSYHPEKFTLEQATNIYTPLSENFSEYCRLVNRYAAVVKADSVKFIYVLQPMLNRVKTNKTLSQTEQKFATTIDPITAPEEQINSFTVANIHGQKMSSYDILHLMLLYAFDLGFSDSLKTTIEKQSALYIDGNQAIQGLGNNVEFYTDYCHLTPQGNKLMAGTIASAILSQIPQLWAKEDSLARAERPIKKK